MPGYFGFDDDYNRPDREQIRIAASLQTTETVTSTDDAMRRIGRLVFAKYKHSILYRQIDNSDRWFVDKKEICTILPGLQEDDVQIILDKMFEAKLIKKDNGQTVFFTPKFIYSTVGKSYFDD